MKKLILAVCTVALVTAGCSSVAADPASSSATVPVSPTTTSRRPTTSPPTPSPYAATIDDWQADNDVVGAVVLVVEPDGSGQPVAVGFRDRQAEAPMLPTDLFRIGSITKVYTAALTLALVEDGILDLDQSAAAYVPNLPDEITVGQLLSHTAGFRDVDVAAGIFEAIEAGGIPEEPRDAVTEALDRGLVFEPGSRQSYSSIGYLAIERVIEGATGAPWDVLLSERVLGPSVETRLEEDAAPLPTPYERLGSASPAISLAGLPTSEFARGAGAAGGLIAPATDVANFIRALFAGDVINAEHLAEMTDLTSPRAEYGLGLAFYDLGGFPAYGHNGRTIGFAASVRHDPASNITVVVLSNDGAAPTDELADALVVVAASGR